MGMVRYADDFVIPCKDKTQTEDALRLVREWTQDNGLTLHPDKTHLGDCSQLGQGFEFLGYRFEAGRRWIHRKSIKALREKVREKTNRGRSGTMGFIVDDLNPMQEAGSTISNMPTVRNIGQQMDSYVVDYAPYYCVERNARAWE
uniref:Reverse transcriptase (RNA-dependent DNA polymerase) n=1 Tax=Candidatus Kentrum sp. LFY TaxID=2126342 RepID=A0A450X552_9GAMM|nr:MAG: Reverse transcriptase (RNA-dependent DNA polymerase) [Candidatus Kentron sp. LFY]